MGREGEERGGEGGVGDGGANGITDYGSLPVAART
jgi:hypothetical protein